MSTIRHTSIPKLTRDAEGKPLCRWCQKPVPPPRRTFCSQACVDEALIRSSPAELRRKTKERDKGICAACGTDTEAIKRQYNHLAKLAYNGVMVYREAEKKFARKFSIEENRIYTVLRGRDRMDANRTVAAERKRAIAQWEHNCRIYRETGRPECADPHPDQNRLHEYRWERIIKDSVILTDQELHARAVARRFQRLCEARRKRMQRELKAAGYHDVDSPHAVNMWQADHIVPVVHGGGCCGLENIRTLCLPCHKRETKELARRRALIRRGIDPDAPPEPDPQLTLL